MATDKEKLTRMHIILFMLQLIVAALVILVAKELVALSPVIGAAQSFFPNPWEPEEAK